jgi:hypothetical protein
MNAIVVFEFVVIWRNFLFQLLGHVGYVPFCTSEQFNVFPLENKKGICPTSPNVDVFTSMFLKPNDATSKSNDVQEDVTLKLKVV